MRSRNPSRRSLSPNPDATQAKRDYDRDATLSSSANETGLQILAPKLVEASKLAWERAENNYQVSQFTTKKSALAMKAGETTKAKADWAAELARARLADTEIKAHFAGVVSFRGIKVGETATPRDEGLPDHRSREPADGLLPPAARR